VVLPLITSKYIKQTAYTLRDRAHILYLTFLSCYVSLIHYTWLRINTDPPWGMGVPFLTRGLKLFHLYHEAGILPVLKEYLSFANSYPQLLSILYFLFYSFFGVNSNLELMINMFFLVPGIIGTYLIGEMLFNKITGALAATLFCAFPWVLNFSKSGYSEFCLMGVVPLALFFLLRSNSFRSLKWSIMFGITFAIMLNIKIEGVVFFVVPLGYIIIDALVRHPITRDTIIAQCINAVLAAGVAAVGGLHWYIVNWRSFFDSTTLRLTGPDHLGISFHDMFYYIAMKDAPCIPQWFQMITVIITVICLFQMFFLKSYSRTIRHIVYLIVVVIVPLIFFSCLTQKYIAHIAPLLPMIALITAAGICSLRYRYVRSSLIAILFLYGLTAPWVSIGAERMISTAENFLLHITRVRVQLTPFYGNIYRPRNSGGIQGFQNVIDRIVRDHVKEDGDKPRVMALLNNEPYSVEQMEYCNLRANSPLEIDHPVFPFMDQAYDYILSLEPLTTSDAPNTSDIRKAVDFIEQDKTFLDHYRMLPKDPVTNETQGVIYKRK
jgi:hypothetical protein